MCSELTLLSGFLATSRAVERTPEVQLEPIGCPAFRRVAACGMGGWKVLVCEREGREGGHSADMK